MSPGLYLGYLKLCTSVEQIRALVPQKLPNVLCHTKIRDNSNVSRWGNDSQFTRLGVDGLFRGVNTVVTVLVSERSGSGCRPSALWRSPQKWTKTYRALHIASCRTYATLSRTSWPTSTSLAIRSESNGLTS